MLCSTSHMYAPLLHPASTPTYLLQAFGLEYVPKLARFECPTVYKPKDWLITWRRLDAFTSTYQLQEGDVVLFATTGVWDNVSAADILLSVSARMFESHCWKEDGCKIAVSSEHLAAATRDASRALHIILAQIIVATAKSRSFYMYGRKLEDITAVVTVVTKDFRNPSVPKTAAHR